MKVASTGRNARTGVWMAGALLACASMSVPAHAQWIGTPGGDGAATVTEPTMPPAQMAPAPSAMSPAPMAPGPMSTPQTGMMPSQGFSPSDSMDQPSAADVAAMKDCQTGVEGLRTDLEKRGAALQGATKKKLPPSELCPMFRSFVTAQQKFSSFLSTNQTKCRVPEDVVKKVKENAANVASVRDRVCKAAQLQESGGGGGGGGPPPQGAVSQGLGLPSGLPSTTSASQKGGVFDTLGGSALR